MAAKRRILSLGDYETLNSEFTACQQHLRSKEEALKIMKGMIESTDQKCSQIEQENLQLRSQLARLNSSALSNPSPSKPNAEASKEEFCKERDLYILQLESAHGTITSLKRELQIVEDERDEVSAEKDAFLKQCESLRQLLKDEQAEDKTVPDTPSYAALESLVEENRKLKLELLEIQAEKDRAFGKILRYKRAVEKRKLRESREQQVPPVSPGGKRSDVNQAVKRAEELELLANSLSESVKEKSIALAHQRKANKVLATRVTELEHKLKVLEISGLWSIASPAVSSQQDCQELAVPLEPSTSPLVPVLLPTAPDKDHLLECNATTGVTVNTNTTDVS